jgi:HemY protein
MRGVIWIVLLFVVAAVAAATLGRNDGLVSFYFGGWRTDLSLNLFVVLLLLACAVVMAAARSIGSLLSLPQRARDWRRLRHERSAHAALREAQAEYFAARYSRAQRAAQRALLLQRETEVLRDDADFGVLARLLAAASLHRMHDGVRRDELLREVSEPGRATARPVDEGASLLAVEWAIDDRDAERAIELLAALPAGVARRTQALRLRLLAQRLSAQPLPALQTARLLAKHQA